MTLDSPDVIWSHIDRLRDALAYIGEQRELVYDYVHDRRDRDRSKTEFEHSQRGSKGAASSERKQVGLSDPTADIVLDQMGARRALASVDSRILKLYRPVNRIKRQLARVVADDEDYEPLESESIQTDDEKLDHEHGRRYKRARLLQAERKRLLMRVLEIDAALRELSA